MVKRMNEKYQKLIKDNQRNRKILIFSALIVLIIIVISYCAFYMISKNNQQKSTPQTENSQEVSKYYFKDSKYEGIASKFIERKTKKEEVSLEIPVTKNSKINDFINKKVKEIDDTFRADTKKPFFDKPATEKMSYQVYYNQDNLISLALSVKQDTHGANLVDENLFWTFDKNSGDVIKLSSFLTDKDKFKPKVLEIFKNKVFEFLKSKNLEYSKDILDELTFDNLENFIILDKQTIDFPFSRSDILPSSYGDVQIQLKISEIYEFLQNDFARKTFDVPEPPKPKAVAPKPAPQPTPVISRAPVVSGNCPNCIAITFDDGPGIYTDRLLGYLQNYNAKATFFMIGPNAQRYSGVARRVFENGHQIGNHTWSHPSLTSLSDAQVQNEISSTNNVLQSITGVRPQALRPPYGATNSRVQADVAALGMASVLWSVDTRDWADRNSAVVCNRAVSNARSGSIILLHDIHPTSVEAVPCILQNLTSRGFRFVTVSQLLGGLQAGQIYYSGK